MAIRINRNIVECKYIQHVGGVKMAIRINRNIVECKCNCSGYDERRL